MALGQGTLIETPNGQSAIEDIVQGGPLMTVGASSGWVAVTVGTVQASGPQWVGTTMVFVGCDVGEFVATPDHVVVLADNSLTCADQLTVGMSLLGSDGGPRRIERLLLGEFTEGIYAIGTDVPWSPGVLAGRLLNTNGFVTGDYLLEIHFQPSDAPRIGTPAYGEVHNAPTESHTDVRNL